LTAIKNASVESVQASRAILRLVVALLVLGAVYLGLATFLSRHVPSNTTVDRIAIGGMTPNEATVTLKRVLAARASQPVHLETPSRGVDIEPGTAGIEIDLDATLSDLTGFTVNPVQMWLRLTGGEDRPLRVRVDRAKLTAAVTEGRGPTPQSPRRPRQAHGRRDGSGQSRGLPRGGGLDHVHWR